MLSRPQQILAKRAQAQCRMPDPDYREAWGSVMPGCSSSKDPQLTDGHLDHFLGYLEAIFWRSVEQGTCPRPTDPRAVFRESAPRYWRDRNSGGTTSRDRYTAVGLTQQIADAETALGATGYPWGKMRAIMTRTRGGWPYLAALRRTLKSRSEPDGQSVASALQPKDSPKPGVRIYQLKPPAAPAEH